MKQDIAAPKRRRTSTKKRALTQQVKEYARQQGARLVGIANIERLACAPKGHRPEDFLPGARSVIVAGLPVLRGYMRFAGFLEDSEKVPETVTRKTVEPHAMQKGYRETHEVFRPREAIRNHMYRRCQYEALNMELQIISYHVAVHLEESGYDTICMPTTYGSSFSWDTLNYPLPNRMAPFSHRHAAVAAGLGRFGMNNLVMTPEYGPLVRLVSIVTEAELEPDPLLDKPLCLGEKCGLCRKSCPNGCFGEKTRKYKMGDGIEVEMFEFNADRCGNYSDPSVIVCGRECWFNCPQVANVRKKKSRARVSSS